ncbi:MAG: hypothetical protein JXQ90_11985 [Cyclobacteriaceae bacterium]
MMKQTLLTTFILFLIFGTIAVLFYQQEIRYWLPTPIPADYADVSTSTKVTNSFFEDNQRPKFVHFFNPECPCSKFNLTSYKTLISAYKDDFECFAVVQNSGEGIASDDLKFLKELNVTLIVDQDQHLAKQLGVYSTPQLALLDSDNQLYYRGNYNQARYCTNPQTFYAKMAIDSLINGQLYTIPNPAFVAYGCSLERHTH